MNARSLQFLNGLLGALAVLAITGSVCAQPLAIGQQPVSRTVLEGAEVAFSVTASGSSPVTYQWFHNASALPQATNATLLLTNVSVTQAGIYRVAVSNLLDGLLSDPATLTVITGAVREVWRARYDGPAHRAEMAAAIGSDAAGNVYVAGSSTGTNNFKDIIVAKYSPAGDRLWLRRFNGPANEDDEARALAVDAAGNVYVTGYSANPVTAQDFITLKYTPDGTLAWARRFDCIGHGTEEAVAIALDGAGNPVVTGFSFCPGIGLDIATVKYDAAGNDLWVARYNGGANRDDLGRAVAVSDAGNVIVVGTSESEDGLRDAVTIQYDANGQMMWVRRAGEGAMTDDEPRALAVDGAGDVLVGGASYDVESGLLYGVILRYGSAGQLAWFTRMAEGLDPMTEVDALAVEGNGNFYAAGRGYRYPRDQEIVLMKFNGAGVPQWSAHDGGAGPDTVQGLTLDALGNAYVAGTTTESTDPAAPSDLLTLKYDPQGTRVWSAPFSGLGDSTDKAAGVLVDAAGGIYVAGTSNDGVGAEDLRLVKYSQQLLPNAPRFTIVPRSQTVVEGTTVNLTVAAIGAQPITYQWYLNGAAIADATNETLVIADIQGYQGGDFYAVASNAVAQVPSPEARITVLTAPFIYSQPDSQGAYRGTEVSFKVLSHGTEPLSYQWRFQDVDIPGATNSVLVIASVQPTNTGLYSVEVSNLVGSMTSSNAALTIITGPVAPVWNRRLDAARYPDRAVGTALDSLGNVFVTGASYDAGFVMGFLTAKYSPDGQLLWTARLPDAEPTALAVDGLGNVYVTGFSGTAAVASGQADFLTAKYDASGNQVWLAKYNGPSNLTDQARAIVVDGTGNVFVAGQSHGGAASRFDIAVVKYGPAGNELWSRRYDGPGKGDDDVGGMAVDAAGSVFVVGTSVGSASGADFVTIKYDSGGGRPWVATYNGPGNLADQARAVALDSAGNVIVAGTSFGGLATRNDFAVVKYGPAGNELWSRRYNGPADGDDAVAGLVVDAADNVFVTGASPGLGTGLDYATLKYDKLGNPGWGQRFDGPDSLNDQPRSIAVDAAGSVYVTGVSESFATDPDIVTLKYSASGAVSWSVRYNGPTDQADEPAGLAIGPGLGVVVAGTSIGRLTEQDILILKYAQQDPSVNPPPTVSLVKPPPGATFAAPASITLQALASDPNGSVAKVEFFEGVTRLGTVTSSPYTLVWSNAPAGSHVLVARATDNQGAERYSNPVRVQVQFPVIVTTPATNHLPPVDTLLNLLVDAAGTGLTYQWRRNGVNIPGATEATYRLAATQPADGGVYSVVVANAVSAVTREISKVTAGVPFVAPADDFESLVLDPDLPAVFRSTNLGASRQPGEPDHGAKLGGHSVWFSWQAPADGVAFFTSRGSGFDTLMAVYTGATLTGLTRVAADDDRGGYLTSAVLFRAKAGTVYHLALDGFAGAAGAITVQWWLQDNPEDLPQIALQPENITAVAGQNVTFAVGASSVSPMRFRWFFNCAPIPWGTNATLVVSNVSAAAVGSYTVFIRNAAGENVQSDPAFLELGPNPAVKAHDKFLNAVPRIQGAGGDRPRNGPATGYTGTQIFSTFGASSEPDEPNHCGVVGGASEWFAYQPPTNGLLNINTDGSDFDSVLAVYTGPGTDYASLVGVACDNDGGLDGRDSSVTFQATGGTIYYIAVDGVNGASGNVHLNYGLTVPPAITNQPQSRTVAAGANAPLSVGVAGTAPLTFRWTFNNLGLGWATNASITITNFQAGNAGLYRVTVTNLAGSVTSQPAALQLNAPLRIGAFDLQAGGAFHVQLLGQAGSNYVIQASINLTNWVPLYTNRPASGIFEFTDATATNHLYRFYRAINVP